MFQTTTSSIYTWFQVGATPPCHKRLQEALISGSGPNGMAMDTILLPRDLLVDHASWMGSGMARRFVYVLPIGSMDGIYANIKGVYWWDPCYHIRRPRQMQGGARQGIILLTLVSDYYHLHYHGVFPSGSCLLNRRSSSSNSSSSNQQQLDWMVFSHLATVFWTEGAAAAATSSSWTGWCFPIWQLFFGVRVCRKILFF